MKHISEIDRNTEEGRLLITAIARLRHSPVFRGMTSDDILAKLTGISNSYFRATGFLKDLPEDGLSGL